jgi:hypothetical protein
MEMETGMGICEYSIGCFVVGWFIDAMLQLQCPPSTHSTFIVIITGGGGGECNLWEVCGAIFAAREENYICKKTKQKWMNNRKELAKRTTNQKLCQKCPITVL